MLLKEDQKIYGNFLNIIALFNYQFPIDQLIIEMKFKRKLINAKIFGDLLANHLCNHYKQHKKPQMIIPVPLHYLRLRERGYNQALELAKQVKKRLKIPIDKANIIRIKNTEPQTLLNAKKRKNNLKHAFKVIKSLPYKHVAIIDDVITTGNTIKELCKSLQQEGIAKIDIWCCALKTNFL